MLNAIVDAALRYKVLVLVAFAVVLGLGVQAFRDVPVDAFPDVTPVQVNIYTESPGLAAEDVERLLSTPIEGAMAGLPGVEGVRSVKVELTWEPPWTPEKMSEAAKLELGYL